VFVSYFGDLGEGVFDAGDGLQVRVDLEGYHKYKGGIRMWLPESADWMSEGGLSPVLSISIVAIVVVVSD
jgi:hypothetical protein